MSDIVERAFVAGATGLTGSSVVAALRQRGLEVHAHVRPDSSRLAAHRERFEGLGAVVDTTAWDEDAMVATFDRVRPTAVFALLGTTKKRARDAKKRGDDPAAEGYEAVDYGLTALLMRAAERSEARPRFVYLSSLGASTSTRNAYLRVRGRIEKELEEGSLPFTVLRPSFIAGDREENRPGEAIGAALIDGGLSVLGALGGRRARDRYSSATGKELAEHLATIAFDPAYEGRVLELDDLRGGEAR